MIDWFLTPEGAFSCVPCPETDPGVWKKGACKDCKDLTRMVNDDGIWTVIQQLRFGLLTGKTSKMDDP